MSGLGIKVERARLFCSPTSAFLEWRMRREPANRKNGVGRKEGCESNFFVTNDLPQSLYAVAGTAVGGERLWTVAIITSKPHRGVGNFLLTCVRWMDISSTSSQ